MSDVDIELAEVVEDICSSDHRFPAMATLCCAHKMGFVLTHSDYETIGRAFERDPAAVARMDEWLCSLISGRMELHRCVSISCTANGAAELWEAVSPDFKALGLGERITPVHCLDQCEHGPCLGKEDEIYTGASECIRIDDRPWRQAPFSHDT